MKKLISKANRLSHLPSKADTFENSLSTFSRITKKSIHYEFRRSLCFFYHLSPGQPGVVSGQRGVR